MVITTGSSVSTVASTTATKATITPKGGGAASVANPRRTQVDADGRPISAQSASQPAIPS